jgi:hypothetical protein
MDTEMEYVPINIKQEVGAAVVSENTSSNNNNSSSSQTPDSVENKVSRFQHFKLNHSKSVYIIPCEILKITFE